MEVALVTGGAAGAGKAIAERLAREGYDVRIADIDGDPPLDVTDARQLTAAIERAKPAVLVNNAGGGGHIPPHFPEATPEQWTFWLDLNLKAPMLATQLALEHGAKAVVNIASTAGWETTPHVSPEYAASKAGLIRFTTALNDPRVSCLIPGWILTERAEEELRQMTPNERERAPRAIALDDIETAVVELIDRGGIRVLP